MSACGRLWSFGFRRKSPLQVAPAGLRDGYCGECGRFGAQDSRAQGDGTEAGDFRVLVFAFAESSLGANQETKLYCRWRY